MADRFRVTNQQQTTSLRPGGGFQSVMRVFAESVPHGVPFSVDVPLPLYSDSTYVHDLLDARAREIDRIADL